MCQYNDVRISGINKRNRDQTEKLSLLCLQKTKKNAVKGKTKEKPVRHTYEENMKSKCLDG